MILRLFRQKPHDGIIERVYGAIVAQARSPALYRDYGVPDTVNGRFELVQLHTLVFLRRVAGEGPDARGLGQKVFDFFCDDMDATLREMGIGDLGVPRQMRRVADAFYGRQRTYEQALATGDEAVALLLRRSFVGAEDRVDAARLAAYLKAASSELAATDVARLVAGEVAFPDPDHIKREAHT